MKLTAEQLAQYDQDGFLVFPELFSDAEVAILRGEVARLKGVEADCVVREGHNEAPKILLKMDDPEWPTYSESFRTLSRMGRTLGVAKQVLGDEALYMHHYKLNVKSAIEGSVWQWHQDYMSWQPDGIPRPELATMMVMLEEATELSGCLYFLPGTHKMGRIEPYFDESTAYKFMAAPPERMKEILASHPAPVPITGKPGTAAIFHCNLFHASGHNLSHRDRWHLYMCYNRCDNRPHEVENPRPEWVRSTNWNPIPLAVDDVLPDRTVTR
jgi:ectoine hydroxylase